MILPGQGSLVVPVDVLPDAVEETDERSPSGCPRPARAHRPACDGHDRATAASGGAWTGVTVGVTLR